MLCVPYVKARAAGMIPQASVFEKDGFPEWQKKDATGW